MIGLTVKTNAEAIDAVEAHLLSMTDGRCMSVNLVGSYACAYLGEDGKYCAISAILDCDDDVRASFDARPSPIGVKELIDEGTLDHGEVSAELLIRLQNLHDNATNWVGGRFVATHAFDNLRGMFGLERKV